MNIAEAKAYLLYVGVCFDPDDETLAGELWLNLNDAFAWGTADSEHVMESQFKEVASLHRMYGWCGILYWVSQQRDSACSEFFDVNRAIDFVRHEEELIKAEPKASKRAYMPLQYVIGTAETAKEIAAKE